jgi:LysR family transcriptional activator of mexEF-oprN operon
MVWLSHVDNDPAERWLRSRLEAFMSERAGLLDETKPA